MGGCPRRESDGPWEKTGPDHMFLPVVERGSSSSDPDLAKHLEKKKSDEKIRFLHRIGDSHYKSKLNNQIYHLSVWTEGENNFNSSENINRHSFGLKRSFESMDSTDLKDINPSTHIELLDPPWRKHVMPLEHYEANRKLDSTNQSKNTNEDMVWKPP